MKQYEQKYDESVAQITEMTMSDHPIELFEHTLDKKALVWFQEHRGKFVDLTTLKTMFLQRYNPWGKTK